MDNEQMIEEVFPGLDANELLELWPTFADDERKIDKYTTTNIIHANIALNSILNDSEKIQLEQLFFSEDGWYKKINKSGMVQLKFAAMSLGLTNNVLTYNSEEEQYMLELASLLTEEQQLLNMKCYLKQKAVTYFTLKKYIEKVMKKDELAITLYRGVRHSGKLQEYLFSGLECWSTSVDIAERFAKNDGYVISKEYPINNIFAGFRSTFKNKPNNIYRNNGFYVRREHEMIVENIEYKYLLDNNFYKPALNEFF
jgi:hypothetical protein